MWCFLQQEDDEILNPRLQMAEGHQQMDLGFLPLFCLNLIKILVD